MPLEAITFVLTDLETGRALVCVKARYASVWPQHAPRPDRRHVSPATWRHLEGDLALGLPSGPLETTSALFQALVPAERCRSVMLQYVGRLPTDAEPMAGLAERLDRLLQGLSSLTNPE